MILSRYDFTGGDFTVTIEKNGIDPRRDGLLEKIVAMYVGKSNVLSFGKKDYLSDCRTVMPFIKDGEAMIPCDFFARTLGLSREDCRATEGATDVCGVRFAPARSLCDRFGIFLHTEENGLVIYSKEDVGGLLDWVQNTRLMRNICEAFVFDDVSDDELAEMIGKRFPSNGHPRLIFTDDKINAIRRELESPTGDAVYKRLFARLIKCAEQFMGEEPSRHELRDGIRLGYVCQENSRRMLTLVLAYRLTDDERYAARAYREMLYSANFPDFNPFHLLDVGEMCLGLGLAYDWLYGYMDEAMREPIRGAIVHKGIYPINEDFDDAPRVRSWNWRGELADNWRLVITGVGVSALAVMDELSGEELHRAKRAAEQTLYDIRRALSLFAPHGAYEEGHAYWYFGMKYFCYLMASLLTCCGTDFGYTDAVGMKMTNAFLLAMNGPVSTFDYHDCDPHGSNIPPEMMFLASRLGRPEEAAPRLNVIFSEAEYDAYCIISDLYSYDPKQLCAYGMASEPIDVYLPVAEVASMRNGSSRDAMWLGFHCDDPIGGEGHDHMDSGTFVLDALGESFFFELGRDDYNLPNYLHTYCVRAEGHNVIVFNPDADYSMKWGGSAKICEHGFSPAVSYAIGDLSGAYRDGFGIKSYRRGAMLLKHCGAAAIQDEVTLTKPADAYWFAHTRAKISLSDDGKTATLTQNGKTLYARILQGDGAVFTVLPAAPFDNSPVIEGQRINADVRKLTVAMRGVNEIHLAIAFSETEDFRIEYTPTREWGRITKEL